jgi:hypothetical protein
LMVFVALHKNQVFYCFFVDLHKYTLLTITIGGWSLLQVACESALL